MRIVLRLAVLPVLCLALACPALAADTLTNIRPSGPAAPQTAPRLLLPGTVVRLPDGRQTRIVEVRPDGIATELGVTLTPQGTVQGGSANATVTVVEENAAPAAPESTVPAPEAATTTPEAATAPDVALVTPEVAPASPDTAPQVPEATVPAPAQPETPPPVPEAPKAETAVAPQVPGVAVPEVAVPEAPATATPQQAAPATPASPGATPHQLTIVELLPMTPAPEQQKAEKTPVKEEAKKEPAPKAQEKKAAPAKQEKARAEKAKAEKPKEQAKPREEKKKAAVGEELRIPPEAVKTGSLDFLEGCWQGTRPEYYSKRMIKECFCFDVNGGSGKRRVIDSIGGRMCIGSSKAKLSKEGVLSVTSSGAACTDGERWGQAEMVCKGTGQRAPCTWVFKDAQGGRQSYEIPFVRVESCGR